MEEKPAVQEAPPTPPVGVPPKIETKSPVWTIVIVVLVVLILAVSAFIAYQLGSKQNSPAPMAVSSPAPAPTPTAIQKRIVYAKENALYLINADGGGKKGLTSSPAGVNSYVGGGSWKDLNDFTYIMCAQATCSALTRNVDTGVESKEVNQPSLSAIAWNHAGTQLAYLYGPVGGPVKLDFKSGATTTTIKTFASSGGGRGGSLDDNASVYFSPDDKYVLVTYTGSQPNDNDKSTVWVFDSGGKEILNLLTDTGWPTQARWMDASSFIYKKGDKVYQRVVTSPTSQVLPGTVGYNPIYLGGKIYSWTNGDLPKIGAIEGYYHSEVLDDIHLVALKAKKLPPEEALMTSFTTAGLSVIDLSTNKATDLDTGDVTLFSVSP